MKQVFEIKKTKPFLKWAGGKGQLLNTISKELPNAINKYNDLVYVEPFVGSGAVTFWILQAYPNIKRAIINDINPDLYKAYMVIKTEPYNLINGLSKLQKEYFQLQSESDRKNFFLERRTSFNSRNLDSLENTILLIFLNRTCFNGLYRVNSKGEFNVPFGKYNNPKICDAETILADSSLLQRITILNGDYSETLKHINTDKAFFYFDPPYKPLSKTSSFNAYAMETFDNKEQERLKDFCSTLNGLGHYWLLSNSDLKNSNIEDNYFDNLYSDFYISRISAKRSINSVASKRGEVSELLISNYLRNKGIETI